MILYNKQDFSLLENDFPDLYYDEKHNTVKGELSFSAKYQDKGKKGKERWRIFPCSNEKHCLQGYYEIAIHLNNGVPVVYETSNKIKTLAEKLSKHHNDLHLYDDDCKCCLGLGINNNLPLSEFIVNWVYTYFVWQTYFEKYNKVPPCGEYPHNILDAGMEYLKNHKNTPCPCSSGKKYKHCHGTHK